jgi:N-methylhydantoinase B/oxoprolinase/acetone carboxylase alpha subunit
MTAHVLAEQYEMQIKNNGYGKEDGGNGAHMKGVRAETSVTGYSRMIGKTAIYGSKGFSGGFSGFTIRYYKNEKSGQVIVVTTTLENDNVVNVDQKKINLAGN